MHIGYWWILVGLYFLLIEIGTPGLFFFISFSVGAFGASCVAFLSYNFTLQCATILILSILTFLVIKKYFANNGHQKLSTNIDALVGGSGIIIQTIEPNTPGRVKVNGEVWRATTPNNSTLAQGSIVTIQAVKGNTITVVKKT